MPWPCPKCLTMNDDAQRSCCGVSCPPRPTHPTAPPSRPGAGRHYTGSKQRFCFLNSYSRSRSRSCPKREEHIDTPAGHKNYKEITCYHCHHLWCNHDLDNKTCPRCKEPHTVSWEEVFFDHLQNMLNLGQKLSQSDHEYYLHYRQQFGKKIAPPTPTPPPPPPRTLTREVDPTPPPQPLFICPSCNVSNYNGRYCRNVNCKSCPNYKYKKALENSRLSQTQPPQTKDITGTKHSRGETGTSPPRSKKTKKKSESICRKTWRPIFNR